MAHIAVYLQRTPQGLHPASAASLCWARDIGSDRGATVTAVCPGDAGAFDRGIVAACGRFGADVVLFSGPGGLDGVQERLNPAHVMVPWTDEGMAAAAGLPGGPVVPRWLDRTNPAWSSADAVTGVVAGVLPWHRFDNELEAEYEGDVDDVPMPSWLRDAVSRAEQVEAPMFQVAGEGRVGFIGPPDIDNITLERLQALRAEPLDLRSDEHHDVGTHIVLAPDAGPLPDELASSRPSVRVVVLPGLRGRCDASWSVADWVFPGAWPDVLDQLFDRLGTVPG